MPKPTSKLQELQAQIKSLRAVIKEQKNTIKKQCYLATVKTALMQENEKRNRKEMDLLTKKHAAKQKTDAKTISDLRVAMGEAAGLDKRITPERNQN